jgi:hypothetical protein
MGISRRPVIVSTFGIAGAAIYTARPGPAASNSGDVVGKISVGHQGWFAGDGVSAENAVARSLTAIGACEGFDLM